MVEQTEVSNLWLSTYSLITVERILGYYQLKLTRENLISTLSAPDTFFYKLVQIPLINIMSGIIRQQAYDLQVYAQKLYVDYLLSGENVKPESSPGANTREEIELARAELVALTKEFHESGLSHNKHISESQKMIIHTVKQWRILLQKVTNDICNLGKKHQVNWSKKQVEELILGLFANLPLASLNEDPKQVKSYIENPELEENAGVVINTFCELLEPIKLESQTLIKKIDPFEAKGESIQQQMRHYRKEFEEAIITINGLLTALPEYAVEPEQDEINRELIRFDNKVTE